MTHKLITKYVPNICGNPISYLFKSVYKKSLKIYLHCMSGDSFKNEVSIHLEVLIPTVPFLSPFLLPIPEIPEMAFNYLSNSILNSFHPLLSISIYLPHEIYLNVPFLKSI